MGASPAGRLARAPRRSGTALRSACPVCLDAGAFLLKLRAPDLLADDRQRYAIRECAGCGLLTTEVPAGRERYPADYYVRFPADPDARRSAARRLRLLQAFRASGRVLDVGCGSGEFLEALQAAGWIACGTEVNRAVVDRLCRRGHRVREGMLPDQRFLPGSFDAVSYIGTFEHVPEPWAELREVRRILRPGGALVLNVTDAGSFEARAFAAAWFGYEAPRHCFNYTQETLSRLLRAEGFEVLIREARQSAFITGYSVACALGVRSHYPRLAPVLERLLSPYRAALWRLGAGNLLEVTARPSQ
jgi:SAM-dependent methyltransferase